MFIDFELQRFTRRCAVTERTLEPGELFYSVLRVEGAEVTRADYSAEAWEGPPADALGWWRSHVPEPNAKKVKLAPDEVLLELFDQLADQPERQEIRYLLTLLLIRRRVLKVEEEASDLDEQANEQLVVYCPRREETYAVPEVIPSNERMEEVEQQLTELLYADAA